jgi:uncharacterized damage-inducible protein DinB
MTTNSRLEQIAQRMADAGEKTVAFFRALPPEKLTAQIYTDGSAWNIKQILYHLVDAERRMRWVVTDVLAGGDGAPEDYDLNTDNEQRVAKMDDEWTLDKLLDAFTEARKTTLAAIASVSDSDLDRMGRHPVLGMRPLAELIKVIYLHNKMHQREILDAFEKA